jgi:peptide chain release factor 3
MSQSSLCAPDADLLPELDREVARRRTFAIISHPDAGKTTLTEKLLLYAGAIELAGAVRGRKNARPVVSDWMDMERERGISISSTAIEFELDDHKCTLLDTPGHNDFSEDTYRTLLAVDSVIMVIDAAKGIEAQTRKLFEVCRLRRLPILTFINKLDQPGLDPFALIDDIERTLGIPAAPMNWPIGSGDRFHGVYDRRRRVARLHSRDAERRRHAPETLLDLGDPRLDETIGEAACRELREAVHLLDEASVRFDRASYDRGDQTPVFFGSALVNVGLDPLLEALIALAPPPGARDAEGGSIAPVRPEFSGFVFKIQANMDPRHRDRIAFVRVCSGRLTKGMVVGHARLGTSVRLARTSRFFGRARQTVESAYPGDVVGLVNPGRFAIGDTLFSGPRVAFPAIPRFPAEHFATLRLRDVRFKQFDEGVRQLEEEGLMQVLYPRTGRREPIVGVVGALQFDMIEARLKSEYGVTSRTDGLPHKFARWIEGAPEDVAQLRLPARGVVETVDRQERPVLLLESDWELRYCAQENPRLRLLAIG